MDSQARHSLPKGPECSGESWRSLPILLEVAGLGKSTLITFLQLWPLVFWFYFIGLIIARRRYA